MKTIVINRLFTAALLLLSASITFAQDCQNSNLIFEQNFNQYNGQNKSYTESMAKNDFQNVGGRPGQLRGISSGWPQDNRAINGELRAEYLKNDAGAVTGGFIFDSSFPGVEEAILEYKVKFDKNFTWATGGKLPGLAGATTLSQPLAVGCTKNQNNIDNSFTMRLMWRSNVAHTQTPYLIVYPYLPNRTSNCGGDIRFFSGLEKDKWYTVKQYIKLNTPGQSNGKLKMYLDGKELLDQNNIMYRLAGKSNVKINNIIMHTYRGGSRDDKWWHSPNTDYSYFDDFKVWTNCDAVTGGTTTTPNQAPTVSLTNPSQNQQEFEMGSTITLRANASDPDNNLDRVNFKINDQYYNQDRTGPDFETQWTPEAPGTYKIGARAFDTEGLATETTYEVIIKESSLAVDQFGNEINTLIAYPNPASVSVTIENIPVSTKSIAIYNVVGKKIKTVNTDNSIANTIKIDVADLRSGMYFIQSANSVATPIIIK